MVSFWNLLTSVETSDLSRRDICDNDLDLAFSATRASSAPYRYISSKSSKLYPRLRRLLELASSAVAESKIGLLKGLIVYPTDLYQ